jgi:hypothetical protein
MNSQQPEHEVTLRRLPDTDAAAWLTVMPLGVRRRTRVPARRSGAARVSLIEQFEKLTRRNYPGPCLPEALAYGSVIEQVAVARHQDFCVSIQGGFDNDVIAGITATLRCAGHGHHVTLVIQEEDQVLCVSPGDPVGIDGAWTRDGETELFEHRGADYEGEAILP